MPVEDHGTILPTTVEVDQVAAGVARVGGPSPNRYRDVRSPPFLAQ